MKTLRILCVGWKRPAARTFSTLALDYHANCDDAAIRQRVSVAVAEQHDMELAFEDVAVNGLRYVSQGIDWEAVEQEEWN